MRKDRGILLRAAPRLPSIPGRYEVGHSLSLFRLGFLANCSCCSCVRGGASATGDSPCHSLLLLAYRVSVCLRVVRLLGFLRPCLYPQLPSAHVLRGSNSLLCVFDLHPVCESYPPFSSAWDRPERSQVLLEAVPQVLGALVSLPRLLCGRPSEDDALRRRGFSSRTRTAANQN